jgi:septum formation protein
MSETGDRLVHRDGRAVRQSGAYGIQGKASLFIEEIEGDYFNIMGLADQVGL